MIHRCGAGLWPAFVRSIKPEMQPRRPHHNSRAFGSITRPRRAHFPMALPEVAPLDIVGTSRDEFASTLVSNNVKDGTPDHRALSLRLGVGKRETRNSEL